MRALLISSALVAAFALSAAADAAQLSLLPAEPEAAVSPSRLVPLAADSVWAQRFEAAADELAAALRSGDEARWAPLLGGQWLAERDRARVRKLLDDRDSPLRRALFARTLTYHAIFGWAAPASMRADERAAIEAGQEAEALVCWSAGVGHERVWPETAIDAANQPGRPYACARITYSMRGDAPAWRAFIEQREPA